MSLYWEEKDTTSMKTWLKKLPSSKLLVILSPTHRHPVRKWPGKNYIMLANYLQKEWKASIVWLWGPGEKIDVKNLASQTNTESYLAPQTTLQEAAALIHLSDLFIGNSNGPSHLAVGVGTNSVQLHGPTQFYSWSPATKKHRGVQSPSGKIEDIGFHAVTTEIEKILQTK